MSAVLAVAASNDGENPVERLVRALTRHGFENVLADRQNGLCVENDSRPQIPVIRFSGKDKDELESLQSRLTDLIIRFYDAPDSVDDQERDTRLIIEEPKKKRIISSAAFDERIDQDLELELSFDGADAIATMPRELFDLTPGLGRGIRERYCAKIERFAAFLERSPVA